MKDKLIKINDMIKYLNIGQITGTNHLVLDFNRLNDEDCDKIYQALSEILLKYTN